MDEKKRSICNISSIVGIVALLIYIILAVVGKSEYLYVMRILFAGIATIAYAIKLGVEISSDEKIGNSIFLIAICLFDVFASALQLIQ